MAGPEGSYRAPRPYELLKARSSMAANGPVIPGDGSGRITGTSPNTQRPGVPAQIGGAEGLTLPNLPW